MLNSSSSFDEICIFIVPCRSSADMTFHKELDTYNPSDILRAHGKANAGYEE